MKNTILSIAAIASIYLVSCQKASVNPNKTNETSTITTSTNENNLLSARTPTMADTRYRYFWGVDYPCCTGQGGNCLPDVVITGRAAQNTIQNILDVIASGNQIDIQATFTQNYSFLDEFLITSDLNAVIDGSLIPSTVSNSQTGIKFMVLKNPITSQITVVYPFKL
jgi:hypothetical protein